MIRQLIKASITIIFIYFCFTLMYLTCVQAGKLKSYENGNEKWKEETIETEYNNPSITIDESNNNDLNNFIKCYQTIGKADNYSQELQNKMKACVLIRFLLINTQIMDNTPSLIL